MEKKERYKVKAPRANANAAKKVSSTHQPKAKPKKLTWKEKNELEGMEERILKVEQEIERIETLFASPNFHQDHGHEASALNEALEKARAETEQLYARWEELEQIPK